MDIYFTNDTLMNNIKITSPDLTDEQIISICSELGFSKFIESMPEKYETILLRNGAPLSSGEKQKIGVLRAFLTDSEIVLFDEVTSDLDGTVESEIINLIKELSKSRIVILASHKIAPILDSKCIFLFDKGSVVDKGTHEELMKDNELYKELFLHEDSGFH